MAIAKQENRSFTEIHDERMKNVEVNAKTSFVPKAGENIQALAEEAYKGDQKKIEEYKTKITNSLAKYMAEGKTVDDLWAWLVTQNCTETAIINGKLRFFGEATDEEGKTLKKELNISDFLKPVEVKAVSSLTETFESERTKEIDNTRLALNELLAEIQGTEKPTSSS